MSTAGFDLDEFVAGCKACAGDLRLIAERVRAAVSAPDAIRATLAGASGERVLFADDELTVLDVRIPPGFRSPPHDHTIWAVVGIYEGREDNTFYRVADGAITPIEVHEVHAPGVLTLDTSVVHAIHNPLTVGTRGLHVYGGNLPAVRRSLWDPDTAERHVFTTELATRYARQLMGRAAR